jgi:hypothetical protein
VAAVLTLVQIKQIRINIHKRNNTENSTNNTKHSKYKYTYYQKPPHITKPTHTQAHALQHELKQPQNELKQTQYKIHSNDIVTIQSSTLNIRSP